MRTLAQDYGGVSEAAISKLIGRTEERLTEDREWGQVRAELQKEILDKS